MAEWHSKMEKVRLEDVRLKREIDRLKQQLKFHENLLKKHEVEVLHLEEDKVSDWSRAFFEILEYSFRPRFERRFVLSDNTFMRFFLEYSS